MTKRNDALDRFVRDSNFAKKTTVIKHPSSKAGGFSPLRQFPQWQEIEAAIKAAPNFPPGEGVEFIFSPEDVAQAGVNFDLAAKRLIRETAKHLKLATRVGKAWVYSFDPRGFKLDNGGYKIIIAGRAHMVA